MVVDTVSYTVYSFLQPRQIGQQFRISERFSKLYLSSILLLMLHLFLSCSSFAFMSAWGWTIFFSVLCKFATFPLVLDLLTVWCDETQRFELSELCDLRIFFLAYCSESESSIRLLETSSVGSLTVLSPSSFACIVLCFFGRVLSKVFLRNRLLVVTLRFCLKGRRTKKVINHLPKWTDFLTLLNASQH